MEGIGRKKREREEGNEKESRNSLMTIATHTNQTVSIKTALNY